MSLLSKDDQVRMHPEDFNMPIGLTHQQSTSYIFSSHN